MSVTVKVDNNGQVRITRRGTKGKPPPTIIADHNTPPITGPELLRIRTALENIGDGLARVTLAMGASYVGRPDPKGLEDGILTLLHPTTGDVRHVLRLAAVVGVSTVTAARVIPTGKTSP